MLNSTNRLKKKKEFAYIYRHGTTFASKYFVVCVLPTKLDEPKIGFVVSKKVGKAHTRNLVKRRLRAIIRELLPQMDQKYNYIITAKVDTVELEYQALKQQILYIFTKNGLVK